MKGNKQNLGRRKKAGLNYFPLYGELFTGDKMKQCEKCLDPSGKNLTERLILGRIIVQLYSIILSESYYMDWNKETEQKVCIAIGNGINAESLKPYLDAMLESNFLNKDLFTQFNILTSRGLQQKWMMIISLTGRKRHEVKEEYYVESEKNKFDSKGKVKTKKQFLTQEIPNNQEMLALGAFAILKTQKAEEIKSDIQQEPEDDIPYEEQTGPIHPDHYMGNWQLEAPVRRCAYHFKTHKDFKESRRIAFEIISHYCGDLPEEEVWERLFKWLDYFTYEQIPKKATRSMKGDGSFQSHFINYIKRRDLSTLPKLDMPKSVENRKKEFKKQLGPYVEEYGGDILNKFYRKWGEVDKATNKLRWEKEPSWELKTRLKNFSETAKELQNK